MQGGTEVQQLRLPHTVDIEINGRCNLDCPWCWGPVHEASIETVSNAQWQGILRVLVAGGCGSVVISGGEPLMRKDLGEVLKCAMDLGLRVTLSTNGLLLKALMPLLEYVDDLGLPLDGPDHATNSKMRVSANPGVRHIDQVLKTIRYVQQEHPRIDLTVRTVVSQRNADEVPKIGGTLLAAGIDPLRLRWKFYQVSPDGPRRAAILAGDWLISDEHFRRVTHQARAANPQFRNIVVMPLQSAVGRYLFLDPSGDAFVMGSGADEFPMKVALGNMIGNPAGVLAALDASRYFPASQVHGG